MEKFCRSNFRPGEIVALAQAFFEQALAHKKLSRHTGMTPEEITAFLQKIGPETSAQLLQLDSKDLHIACLEASFVAGEEALASHYTN